MIHEKCLFSYLVNVFTGLWQNHDRLCVFVCVVWLLQNHDAMCVCVVWLLQNQSELSLDDCLRLFMKEEELEAEERPVSALATSFLSGWVGGSSVGWVSDWKARRNTDVGLIPWCGKGFFSRSQISLLVPESWSLVIKMVLTKCRWDRSGIWIHNLCFLHFSAIVQYLGDLPQKAAHAMSFLRVMYILYLLQASSSWDKLSQRTAWRTGHSVFVFNLFFIGCSKKGTFWTCLTQLWHHCIVDLMRKKNDRK